MLISKLNHVSKGETWSLISLGWLIKWDMKQQTRAFKWSVLSNNPVVFSPEMSKQQHLIFARGLTSLNVSNFSYQKLVMFECGVIMVEHCDIRAVVPDTTLELILLITWLWTQTLLKKLRSRLRSTQIWSVVVGLHFYICRVACMGALNVW